MMRREVVLVLTAALLSGCGGKVVASRHTTPAEQAGKRAVRRPSCEPAGGGFRTCHFSLRNWDPMIQRRVGSRWSRLAGPLSPAAPDNEWSVEGVSPDGRTLLAEWLFSCDGSVVVFVPLDGGRPRIVTGQRDWTKAPRSRALGWTGEGKAKARVYNAWRDRSGRAHRAGVYLFDPGHPARAARTPSPAGGC